MADDDLEELGDTAAAFDDLGNEGYIFAEVTACPCGLAVLAPIGTPAPTVCTHRREES